jgi:hypothetical protein
LGVVRDIEEFETETGIHRVAHYRRIEHERGWVLGVDESDTERGALLQRRMGVDPQPGSREVTTIEDVLCRIGVVERCGFTIEDGTRALATTLGRVLEDRGLGLGIL